MSYPISVYAIESGEKKECNVIAFFRNAISVKLYVIIESPFDKKSNSIIPLLVNNDEVEQEPQLLEDNTDKNIITEFCKKNLENKYIEFSPSENSKFFATLDLEDIKMQEAYHSMQLQDMLRQKDDLDIDKLVGQIDKRIVELSLNELNENAPELVVEFVRNCISVSKYDLWLNKRIEEAKNKISKFENSEVYSLVLNQLKALQSVIVLLSEPIKEKQAIEDALVEFVEFLGEDKSSLNAILNNGAIRSFLSENERKIMYGAIVLRANEKFSSKTINAMANYFYKEKEFKKSVKLFTFLIERCESDLEDLELVDIYNSIGCCYVGMMKFEDAYTSFKQTIEINPDYAVAYNNWAYTLAVECNIIPKDSIRDAKLHEALRRINQAIQHKNDDVSFYSNKACVDYELNNFQAVIEDFNDAKRISSSYKDLETILKLKIYSQLELHYAKSENLNFSYFLNDLEIIFKNKTGSDKYLFQALEVYHKTKDYAENADEISLRLIVFEFIVDKLMSALAIRNLNQDIYYYTSLSNLQRLLADDEFRQPIFCANHMNDPNEGQELRKALLQQITNKELLKDLFIKPENSTTEKQRQKLNAEFTFLKAFTENDDTLPMWVHYGDQGKGCCIKVNSKFFSNFENNSDVEEKTLGNKPFDDQYRLYRVLYLKDGVLPTSVDLEIRQLYDQFIRLFEEICLKYISYDRHLKDAVSSSIFKIINSIMYLFKNTDYQYEREMRIVLRRSMADFEREDIDVQITNSTESNPIPKVFIYTKKPLEIEEVILGPKTIETDNLLPYISMRLLKLNSHHQEEQIFITKSIIEYR